MSPLFPTRGYKTYTPYRFNKLVIFEKRNVQIYACINLLLCTRTKHINFMDHFNFIYTDEMKVITK